MLGKKRNRTGVIIGAISSVVLLAIAGWLLLNRQYVTDQITVWSYKPSDAAKAIKNRIGFTDKGSFVFGAARASLDESSTFNVDCPREETGSPILGCYAGGRIYVYDVNNAQLDGIEEVTAAHETLHAVWERTSDADKQHLGILLRAEYNKLGDGELKTRMDYYARTEPGEFENELHSIIGTEVSSVSPELETYYAKFFKDRKNILKLHDQYNSVFQSLSSQADVLDKELTTLGTSIQTRTTQYNTDAAQLSADIDDFNKRADEGSFTSMSQFNRERAALVARSNQLSADRTSINKDITTYNTKYDEYKSIASQIELLNKSIDSISNLAPAPSL